MTNKTPELGPKSLKNITANSQFDRILLANFYPTFQRKLSNSVDSSPGAVGATRHDGPCRAGPPRASPGNRRPLPLVASLYLSWKTKALERKAFEP